MNVREQIRKLTPERFEELCWELLRLDGFTNVILNAKGADDGCDLTADKSYPIAHGRVHLISWLGQCKHTSSDRALSADVVKGILHNFETQDDHQGLIIITNAKLSAGALKRMSDLRIFRHRPVIHWDMTVIEEFFDTHPFLIDKFGLDIPSQTLVGAGDLRVLILSDGSVFAYQVFDLLRKHGFDVRETRLHQFGANALSSSPYDLAGSFDLAFVFLAELYWAPIEHQVIDGIRASIKSGLKAVFTPFCAWSVGSRLNPSLDELLPVRVREASVDMFRLLSPDPPDRDRKFDLPAYSGTFIENQLVSFAVEEGSVSRGSASGTIRSTFEFLEAKRDASVLVRDSEGNPLLVVGDRGRGRTAYFNMCAHNCLTPFPMKSPLEGNEGLSRLPAEFALSFGNG